MATSISKAIKKAKTAHNSGQLSTYQPLLAAGANARTSTTTASWGPAMRR